MTRTLSERELNRALLARQMLLERVNSPIPRVLERMGGLQAQYAPSMYVGLWSRLDGFERDQLTRALERRSVIQGSMMRATIHLVSKRDYWPFVVGIRQAQRKWWLRTHGRDLDGKKIAANDRKVRRAFDGGTLNRAELEAVRRPATRLCRPVPRPGPRPALGTWERRRADLYALAEDWVGPESATENEGIELLVRRYLQGFGPARPAEIADWASLDVTSTTKRRSNASSCDASGTSTARSSSTFRACRLPDADTPAAVRFLPVWDATLLVHARRTQILPERYRSRIFNTRNPQSVNTFLVDGQVAGMWRYEKGRVKIEPFGRLSKSVREELEDEAERLGAFHE